MASWTDRTVTDRHVLPYVDSSTAPEHIAKALKTMPFERNIFKILANADSLFVPFMGLLTSCWGEGRELRGKEWQLIVLTTAVLHDAPYEWDVNEPVARTFNYTDKHFAAIKAGDLSDHSLFNPRQRLIHQMVNEIHKTSGVTLETIPKARELLGNKAIAEVVILYGTYATIANLIRTSQIDFDPPIEGLEGLLRQYNAKALARDESLAEQDSRLE